MVSSYIQVHTYSAIIKDEIMVKDSLEMGTGGQQHEAVFGFEEAVLKLEVTTWVPRFMQSVLRCINYSVLLLLNLSVK